MTLALAATLLWLLAALVLPALAADVHATPDTPLVDMTFGQLMTLVTNVGLGGLVFFVWFRAMKRETSMETLIGRYNESQAAHLAAFQDINKEHRAMMREVMEQHRRLAEETRDAVLLNVQVNTRLVEKLDYVLEQGRRPARES